MRHLDLFLRRPVHRARACLVALASSVALVGCGGGLVIGVGGGDDYPDVSVVASVGDALPGQAVRLSAAAQDDDYVAEVQFYRLEPDGSATFLGRAVAAPYLLDTFVPPGALRGSTVAYFARAIDSAGQATDSDLVGVLVD